MDRKEERDRRQDCSRSWKSWKILCILIKGVGEERNYGTFKALLLRDEKYTTATFH